MDTEKILKNLDRVTPFFQPIFSADQHQVIGYEILGRYEEQSEYKSLGPFFTILQCLKSIGWKWIITYLKLPWRE